MTSVAEKEKKETVELSTAELMRKENENLKKSKRQHRERLKKLENKELKRIGKVLKETKYFEYKFTDDDVYAGINRMIKLKYPGAVIEPRKVVNVPKDKNKDEAPSN